MLALLLPNMPPPGLVLAPPKMLPPVFVFEPKPEDEGGKLDMFELHGAALVDRCATSIASRGRMGPAEKKKSCLPPLGLLLLLLLLLLLDPKPPPKVDWVLLLEPKPPKPDPNDIMGCRYEARVYVFRP